MNARNIQVILFLIFLSLKTSAQYTKYIVQFTDKYNSTYSLANPSQYLSQRAIERRTRYNIKFDSTDLPVNKLYIDGISSKGDVTVLSESKWLNQVLINCSSLATINVISSLPYVKNVRPVALLKERDNIEDNLIEKTTPVFSKNTNKGNGLQDVFNYGSSYEQVHIHNGEYLHNKGYSGNGMQIALIDAGYKNYETINAFDSSRANNKFLGVRDFVTFDNSVNEDDTHGELCLSAIAANVPGTMVGTAPHAAFYLLRSENVFTEFPIEEHNWVAAAEFADSAGADLISSSLGYYSFDDSQFDHSYNDFYNNTTMVSQGATFAAQKGMIVTNSAGNEGNNSWKYIIFPADADSVCAVGAIDKSGNIAGFSSYGYPGKVKPNVVSVGAGTTLYASNGVVTANGTSFSNPNLNGLITCLWQAFPAYNNMTILDAVYKSSDRYNNPDNRYGYGIPNMKTAWQILKKTENQSLYGNDWLFVSPDTFTNVINVKVIGQTEGNAQLLLLNEQQETLATINLEIEVQEVYDTAFSNLNNLPPGNYFITYKDASTTRTEKVVKTGYVLTNWLVAAPVPFDKILTAYITAPETNKAIIRLINSVGRIIQSKEIDVVNGMQYQVKFYNSGALSRGAYYLQYISSKNNKTIKVLR